MSDLDDYILKRVAEAWAMIVKDHSCPDCDLLMVLLTDGTTEMCAICGLKSTDV